MDEPITQAPPPAKKKPLDTVVKLALMVLFGSFGLIWGGMYLSRPDRTIPPYSIGSQEGTAVSVHVPPWTSDTEIETLIERFRKVGQETRNFGPMKIRPTTPEDPGGRYRRMTIFIFTHDAWAEADILHKYLAGEDREVREGFRRALRGLYRLTESEEEGRIGPLVDGPDSAATAAYSRQLFKGPVPAQP
ncbi:MAG TPA: hypothetical protein VLE03_01150 [Nitrospiraceae bacterium]|jgi:hypothetical protein|nr:hypothetical protein [Nitrospiraceae bacterium]